MKTNKIILNVAVAITSLMLINISIADNRYYNNHDRIYSFDSNKYSDNYCGSKLKKKYYYKKKRNRCYTNNKYKKCMNPHHNHTHYKQYKKYPNKCSTRYYPNYNNVEYVYPANYNNFSYNRYYPNPYNSKSGISFIYVKK